MQIKVNDLYEMETETSSAAFNAVLRISMVSGMNILTISLIAQLLTKAPILSFIAHHKTYVIIIALLNFIVNYFLLMYNGKYKKIIAEFANASLSEKRKNKLVTLTYLAISFIVLIGITIRFTISANK